MAVLSPKANVGDVTQSNEASNDASAVNRNVTDQAVAQDQSADAAGSTGYGPAGQAAVSQDQAADVANATSQEAQAPVTNEQSNEAATSPAPVAHGKDDGCGCEPPPPPPAPAGDVEQSNEATNVAAAGNTNHTDQQVGQVQVADSTGGAVTQDQSADVANATDQSAAAAVDNDQSNETEGPAAVSQSNAAFNQAAVSNTNGTKQSVAQGQAGQATATGKHGDAAVDQDQSADVSNGTDQLATATVDNDQANAVRDDHGKGKDKGKDHGKGKGKGRHGPAPIPGDVTQSNEAINNASATNVNGTRQAVVQGQAGEATATGKHGDAAVHQAQSAAPTNVTRQAADAPVLNDQVNVVERPNQGSVTQSNEARNDAAAANTNTTAQAVAQGQAASVVAHGPKDHGPKGHGPKDHGPKDHGPKDHGPKHDECTPAPCAPAPCPR